MLRITQSKNGAGAARYFDEGLQRGDYYAKEEAIGQWGGKLATRLGLSGEVKKEDFVALCENRKPDGSQLNPRHSPDRRVGNDFCFSVPKSVSTVYAITNDERIRNAFEQAVEETMQELERQEMRTQIGQGKEKQHHKTSEMVWASFTHRTSRPVDGEPDPHLHRHCFAFNTTWNEQAGRFQAGEFGAIKQAAPYYEAAFNARLSDKLKRLGYGIARQVNARGQRSWEIAGLDDPALLAKFSRRTSLIESVAAEQKEKGEMLTARQKAQLGALTREKKPQGQSYQQLRELCRARLSEEESDAVRQAPHRAFGGESRETVTAKQAVNRAQGHLFERKSVATPYQLKAEALKRGYGDLLPDQVEEAINQGPFFRREIGGKEYITTREAVKEEEKMLAYIRQGRGKELPLNPHYWPKADYLNEQQQAAIHHALNDTHSVTVIAGGAGTGKTTLMKEVRDGIEARGIKFIGVAPSAAASRGVMREEGFDGADTLAQLLHNPKMQEQARDGVIWVDEAGMIGSKDMNKLFEIAGQQNARLLLTGDIRQHRSVAAGDALRILQQEGGIKTAQISEIQRQRSNLLYKQAVALAAQGKTDAALLQLDRMGNVVEIEEGRHRLTMLVTDYSDALKQGKTALIVSPTHIEGKDVTETLRQKLKYDGLLAKKEQSFLQLKNTHWTKENKADAEHYRREDLIVEFHQNATGHVKGERWHSMKTPSASAHSIQARSPEGELQSINLKESARFSVYQREEIKLAAGDKIRLTKGGKTREGVRVNNGDIFTINGFTRQGHIKLHTGKTLDKAFGHLTHGYVTTSHSAQGKTVDRVFIAQSSQSGAAASQQQLYVSISRGRQQCRIYTDDKQALEQAVKRDNERMTAREVVVLDRERRNRKMRSASPLPQPQKQKEYGKGTAL